MKKIILRKPAEVGAKKRKGYAIDYESELNPAQYEAVMHNNGAALVIAGAGTGKTRTLIYRLARLVEDGVPPESILLLTFTRKAASEMLRRASNLLDGRCEKVTGGTFHSFALMVLRRYANLLGFDTAFNVLDSGDSQDTINLIRTRVMTGMPKKRFPRKDTLQKIFNLSLNRCLPIEDVLLKDFPFFLDDIEKIESILSEYQSYKKQYSVMDYDDMLVYLLELIKEHEDVKKVLNKKFKYVMVDEYQDTNKLQHDLVSRLAGKFENIMAVGDDAQSIYSFRGAEFQNIISFPDNYKDCKLYKIEENYRSVQPILTLTNKIIKQASFRYEKNLFTRRISDELPKIITSEDERQQSLFLVQQILELREQDIPLEDMAVLFRSGFLSFDFEIELTKANIPYRKFGGMKFIETAHVKDMLSYFKILFNPRDAISWHRLLLLQKGVGQQTASKIMEQITSNVSAGKAKSRFSFQTGSKESIESLIRFLNDLSEGRMNIGEKAVLIAENYKNILKNKYDDWKKRWKDIEMFISIAGRYTSLNDFLNDMAIEPPVESVIDIEEESKEQEYLNLSTVHSAKGLEWKVVFIIWALDGRFPSSKSAESINALEEERRLFYVACTRAKDELYITYPTNIYDRESGIVLSKPTRFLDGIDEDVADKFILQEWEQSEN
ncbi:ATP-dependent helicase [Bacteroidota bacterium]